MKMFQKLKFVWTMVAVFGLATSGLATGSFAENVAPAANTPLTVEPSSITLAQASAPSAAQQFMVQAAAIQSAIASAVAAVAVIPPPPPIEPPLPVEPPPLTPEEAEAIIIEAIQQAIINLINPVPVALPDMPLFPDAIPGPSHPGPDMITPPVPPAFDPAPVPIGVTPPPMPTTPPSFPLPDMPTPPPPPVE